MNAKNLKRFFFPIGFRKNLFEEETKRDIPSGNFDLKNIPQHILDQLCETPFRIEDEEEEW